MKKITSIICLAAFVIVSCNNEQKTDAATSETAATDTAAAKTEPAPPQMDSAAMAKAWMDFATPGPMHAWMAKLNGTWEAEITELMDPSGPKKSKATNVMSSAINGLYQEGKYSGNMMGAPFEGRSIMGYDNSKKKFVSTWIDNMGSGIVVMWGSYDEATKTLNLKGVQSDPVSGKDTDIREVMKITDDNNYTLEMYGAGPDGKEVKFMEGVFKRKK